MSFKTSVLIWFSRFLWYGLTPSPSPAERGAPNGVRLLCETEEHGIWRHGNRVFRQKDSKFAARNLNRV